MARLYPSFPGLMTLGNKEEGRSRARAEEDRGPELPLRLPGVEVPKGGGAIRGSAERFRTNAATGAGSMRVDLGLSPGRNGFTPELALAYDSGAGNGPWGLGWSL